MYNIQHVHHYVKGVWWFAYLASVRILPYPESCFLRVLRTTLLVAIRFRLNVSCLAYGLEDI